MGVDVLKNVILFINSLSKGGAERTISNISSNLSYEINSIILVLNKKTRVDYSYKGKLIYIDEFNDSSPCGLYQTLKRVKSLNKIKKNNAGSTIISFLEYPNFLNLFSKKHGRTIISIRNYMSIQNKRGLKSQIRNIIIKLFYNNADLIIAVSKQIRKDLIENYGIYENKIKVIYNSYPIEEIKKQSEEDINLEYKDIFLKPVIITVGRLNKQKGHCHLLRSIAEVKKTIPDVNLVFLGEGELELSLKKLSKDLEINHDVYFLGFQQNPFKYIAKSKIFAMSSLHEGFPNALAEAMACGIPIISSDCLSGPREILSPNEYMSETIKYDLNLNRYGVLVPVCDGNCYDSKEPITNEEKIMAAYIISLLQDKNLWDHFSKQSLSRIKDFDINNIIKEWESII